VTVANGGGGFGNFGPGIYRPREVVQPNYIQTTAKVDVVASSGTDTNVYFGNFHTATISGQVFKDFNASGLIDTGEPGLSGWTVFLDLNNNGIIDAGETSVTTDATGNYSFPNVGPGQVTVREVVQSGWSPTTNSSSSPITVTSGMNQTINFGDLQQFVVVNTHDSGLGSLRQAIADANATAGATVINITFGIPATGLQTIAPISALPAINHPVVIDGYSQPGTSPNTLANGDNAVLLIELSGAQAANADGLSVSAASSTVKGLIVNRFTRSAIGLFGNASTVSGNWIGVDSTGTAVAANSTGIAVFSSNNQIGGTTPAARNVISGNIGTGIGLNGSSTNQVQGNFIGTDITGTIALGNKNSGLSISGSNNTIGGTTPGAGNLISGNGIGVLVANASGNFFQGNLVGTKADGTSPLGNLDDGFVVNGASNNTIGGAGAGAGNTIAFNGKAGVFLTSNASVPVGDSILANSIFSNSGLGVDLSPNGSRGVTPNDPGDADTGPNNLQNFPQLSFANQNSSGLNVAGSLNSTPSTSFRIEFFVNSACDSSGSGEGQIFIGSTNVTTDANGLATINGNLTPGLDVLGKFVTSTATRLDAQGNSTDTSEFSTCVRVPSADLALTGSAAPNPVRSGDNLIYTFKIANNGPDAATNVGFSDQLPSAATFVSCSVSGGAACSSTACHVSAALGNLANGGQV
ncbi:MAG TPA: SdrD B-like domain-containing protein, partial [Pyrinomonadaceae bacterium]|nr:SdrD B-like domain-containing protein [Pyrinomonadaceae bacterium]